MSDRKRGDLLADREIGSETGRAGPIGIDRQERERREIRDLSADFERIAEGCIASHSPREPGSRDGAHRGTLLAQKERRAAIEPFAGRLISLLPRARSQLLAVMGSYLAADSHNRDLFETPENPGHFLTARIYAWIDLMAILAMKAEKSESTPKAGAIAIEARKRISEV